MNSSTITVDGTRGGHVALSDTRPGPSTETTVRRGVIEASMGGSCLYGTRVLYGGRRECSSSSSFSRLATRKAIITMPGLRSAPARPPTGRRPIIDGSGHMTRARHGLVTAPVTALLISNGPVAAAMSRQAVGRSAVGRTMMSVIMRSIRHNSSAESSLSVQCTPTPLSASLPRSNVYSPLLELRVNCSATVVVPTAESDATATMKKNDLLAIC